MFPSASKLALLILVIVAVWCAVRWINRLPLDALRRRPAASPQPREHAAIEDLVACRRCGTYLAAGAPACGRTGCPQPR